MAICKFCGDEFPEARAELGKDYCMKRECVKLGTAEVKFVEVGYGKAGVDLMPVGAVNSETLKNTGNRGRS